MGMCKSQAHPWRHVISHPISSSQFPLSFTRGSQCFSSMCSVRLPNKWPYTRIRTSKGNREKNRLDDCEAVRKTVDISPGLGGYDDESRVKARGRGVGRPGGLGLYNLGEGDRPWTLSMAVAHYFAARLVPSCMVVVNKSFAIGARHQSRPQPCG